MHVLSTSSTAPSTAALTCSESPSPISSTSAGSHAMTTTLPGQQLMRDTGRYHFFFLGELEVCET